MRTTATRRRSGGLVVIIEDMNALEQYINEMENRSAIDNPGNVVDVWTQLQQKENDLVLAAELGKALLEKNEELKKQQDAIVEEYSKKLEAVEQDRHVLKRKLTTLESEYEGRILELENDLKELHGKLTAKETTLKQWERDKGNLLQELNVQNSRLTGQLKDYVALETQLQQQIEALKEQCAIDKCQLQEHMASVNSLRDELDLTMEKKNELERRLQLVANERDHLGNALEEANDKVLLLERHARDQDMRYQQSIKEYSLPSERLTIEERLNPGEHRSLLSEMDVSEPTLSQECMSVYRQLRSLLQQLKTHHDDDDSGLHSDCSTTSLDETQHFSTGLLSEVAQELVALVLDTDVVSLLERLEQSRKDVQERDAELTRRAETIMELTTKVSVIELELQAALEERDRARTDASSSSMAQDEVVSKARDDRDQAVARRSKAEIELAKTRVELMQANSQLLEAIQQKVELSQQLEQWQMDMQELLDEQLKNKLTSHEMRLKQEDGQTQNGAPIVPPRRRLLRFFHR